MWHRQGATPPSTSQANHVGPAEQCVMVVECTAITHTAPASLGHCRERSAGLQSPLTLQEPAAAWSALQVGHWCWAGPLVRRRLAVARAACVQRRCRVAGCVVVACCGGGWAAERGGQAAQSAASGAGERRCGVVACRRRRALSSSGHRRGCWRAGQPRALRGGRIS